jgi:hypothetical protein
MAVWRITWHHGLSTGCNPFYPLTKRAKIFARCGCDGSLIIPNSLSESIVDTLPCNDVSAKVEFPIRTLLTTQVPPLLSSSEMTNSRGKSPPWCSTRCAPCRSSLTVHPVDLHSKWSWSCYMRTVVRSHDHTNLSCWLYWSMRLLCNERQIDSM